MNEYYLLNIFEILNGKESKYHYKVIQDKFIKLSKFSKFSKFNKLYKDGIFTPLKI